MKGPSASPGAHLAYVSAMRGRKHPDQTQLSRPPRDQTHRSRPPPGLHRILCPHMTLTGRQQHTRAATVHPPARTPLDPLTQARPRPSPTTPMPQQPQCTPLPPTLLDTLTPTPLTPAPVSCRSRHVMSTMTPHNNDSTTPAPLAPLCQPLVMAPCPYPAGVFLLPFLGARPGTYPATPALEHLHSFGGVQGPVLGSSAEHSGVQAVWLGC
jgi:hypothetical protein